MTESLAEETLLATGRAAAEESRAVAKRARIAAAFILMVLSEKKTVRVFDVGV